MILRMVAGLVLCAAFSLAASDDPISPPPKEQDPCVAERGYFENSTRAWNDFHRKFIEQGKRNEIELLFLGDSILQAWGDTAQKDLWKDYFEPYKSVNFSIGGDRTQQVLWRIANGELDGLKPKVAVLEIGTNNLWANDLPDPIAAAIKKIVEAMRAKMPNTKILIIGILPVQKSALEAIREKIRLINAQTARLADGSNVRFLDLSAKFVDASGNIALEKELYQPDFVHLTPKGYEAWAIAVKPVLIEMLK